MKPEQAPKQAPNNPSENPQETNLILGIFAEIEKLLTDLEDNSDLGNWLKNFKQVDEDNSSDNSEQQKIPNVPIGKIKGDITYCLDLLFTEGVSEDRAVKILIILTLLNTRNGNIPEKLKINLISFFIQYLEDKRDEDFVKKVIKQYFYISLNTNLDILNFIVTSLLKNSHLHLFKLTIEGLFNDVLNSRNISDNPSKQILINILNALESINQDKKNINETKAELSLLLLLIESFNKNNKESQNFNGNIESHLNKFIENKKNFKDERLCINPPCNIVQNFSIKKEGNVIKITFNIGSKPVFLILKNFELSQVSISNTSILEILEKIILVVTFFNLHNQNKSVYLDLENLNIKHVISKLVELILKDFVTFLNHSSIHFRSMNESIDLTVTERIENNQIHTAFENPSQLVQLMICAQIFRSSEIPSINVHGEKVTLTIKIDSNFLEEFETIFGYYKASKVNGKTAYVTQNIDNKKVIITIVLLKEADNFNIITTYPTIT
ncbi:MAG: hypothetical protein KatS3mg085_082 [Candidatus Dojkabacteria bacterium]|nr:MAG: hypothetical protein KatS3mg085_082 [Candidatus Dojkabacteria bacterium]